MKENNETDLISRRALYDKCVELEQEALKVVLTTDDKIEKLIWNAVLTERSAFKFAVVDAPASLDNPSAETKQKGKWETVPYKKIEHGEVVIDGDAQLCSVCRHAEKGWNKEMKYCPNCGAEMSKGE